MLDLMDRTPFTLTLDDLHLHGSLDVDWRRADAGVAALSLKLRVDVGSLADAASLEWALPGASALYDASRKEEEHRPTQLQAPRGLEGTRTVQVWIASDGRPAGDPMHADVEIRSITVSTAGGRCTLSVGMRGRASARSVADWDMVASGPVIARAVAAQPSLLTPAAKDADVIDLPDDVDPFADVRDEAPGPDVA